MQKNSVNPGKEMLPQKRAALSDLTNTHDDKETINFKKFKVNDQISQSLVADLKEDSESFGEVPSDCNEIIEFGHLDHSEYAAETFQYLKERESVFRVVDYIGSQEEISTFRRAILVDWLVDVQVYLELHNEILYRAVKMTDIYLSRRKVKKENLQLVGAAAFLLAFKIEKGYHRVVDDLVCLSDDSFTKQELMKMERRMLRVLGFDIGIPLSYSFLRR